jgi:hypothetical protein
MNLMRSAGLVLLAGAAVSGCDGGDTELQAAAAAAPSASPSSTMSAPPLDCDGRSSTGIYDWAELPGSATPSGPGDPLDATGLPATGPRHTPVVVKQSAGSALVRVVNASGESVVSYKLITMGGDWVVSTSRSCWG